MTDRELDSYNEMMISKEKKEEIIDQELDAYNEMMTKKEQAAAKNDN